MNAIEGNHLRWEAGRHGIRAPARPAQPGDIASAADIRGLKELLARRLGATDQDEFLALIKEAEMEGQQSRGEIAAETLKRILSFVQLRMSGSYQKRLRLLLPALQALQHDKSFDLSVETEASYISAAQELALKGFSTIVFGHTHLAKEVSLYGGAKYLNTGIWADLVRVPQEIISESSQSALNELERFAEALRTKHFSEYLFFRPTFAHICLDEQGCTLASSVRTFEPGKALAL